MGAEQNSLRIGFSTLGCKVNQCDTTALAGDFEKRGCRIVPFGKPADIYIINTCTVTAYADAQARQLIRKAKRANPSARIIVTGCLAQTRPEEVAAVDGVSLIVGNDQKHQLFDLLKLNETPEKAAPRDDGPHKTPFLSAPAATHSGRTRAFFKIQDGCDAFCTYCIVPYARGRSRSLPAGEVLRGAQACVDLGFREIVLTGIHLGHYGHDLSSNPNLTALLEKLLTLHPAIRFRLSSIEPNEISQELIALFGRHANLCPHLHIPMQSGDACVLKRMNRTYSPAQYRRAVEDAVSAVPDIAIGADVMVGFPGESDQAFDRTVSLLFDLPVAYLHVFPYSERPKTEAASLEPKVPEKIKKERAAILRRLSDQKREAFSRRFIGRTLSVLVEQTRDKKTGLARGFSLNYLPVVLDDVKILQGNQVVDVRAQHYESGKLYGRLQHG